MKLEKAAKFFNPHGQDYTPLLLTFFKKENIKFEYEEFEVSNHEGLYLKI